MTKSKNVTQGQFSWHELMTKDAEGAKGFYGELLGWNTEAMKMGDGTEYTMLKAGDSTVGGMTKPPADEVPPHWAGYVTVESVDDTAAKVTEHGGAALMDAFDVPGVGRIQPVKDPQGAALLLFTPEEEGPEPTSGAGQWHWNELWATDAEKAAQFYCDAFGYEKESMEMPTGSYFVLKSGGVPRAGVMASPEKSIPPHWAFYVHVDDVDATQAKAKKLGGDVQGEAMEVPGVGRFAFITDREGARLGVITPAES